MTWRDDCPSPTCRMAEGDGTTGPDCDCCGGLGYIEKTADDLLDEAAQLREDAKAYKAGSEWRRTAEAKATRLEALVSMYCGGMVGEAAE